MNDDKRWAVTVDHGRCLGTGVCVAFAPGRFRLTGYRSNPVVSPLPQDDQVLAAAESCPMEAIEVRDLVTGRRVAPEGEPAEGQRDVAERGP